MSKRTKYLFTLVLAILAGVGAWLAIVSSPLFDEYRARAARAFGGRYPLPKEAFTASYERMTRTPKHTTHLLVSYDGKTRMLFRTDIDPLVAVEDLKQQKTYYFQAGMITLSAKETADDATARSRHESYVLHSVGETKDLLTAQYHEALWTTLLLGGPRPLGTKMIDGHECRGWQSGGPGFKQNNWYDTESACLVRGETLLIAEHGNDILDTLLKLTSYRNNKCDDFALVDTCMQALGGSTGNM